MFFDNFAPGDIPLFRDASAYGSNWEDPQNSARTVLHGLTGANEALVGDSVASTTLGFVGRIERIDGEVIAFDGRSQLGWDCTGDGWKIRHELNYAWVVEPEANADLIGHRGAPTVDREERLHRPLGRYVEARLPRARSFEGGTRLPSHISSIRTIPASLWTAISSTSSCATRG